ncbi:MAG: ubiquinol-cytochrome c reductase iron-sulfur subunit [Gammaproteobacteria bacterium]
MNRRRRRLLTITTVLGGIGAAVTATPFILSMKPSARALAAGGPVNVDISKLEAGQILTVEWRGKPVWIVRRTPAMLAQLERNAPLLVDPNSEVASQQPSYAKNVPRSIKPEALVVIGICTHLGCVPSPKLAAGAISGIGSDWPGGYFCPCHGSKFDLAGRVFKNVPAPTNLVVPPHRYVNDALIEIGADQI